MVKVKPGEYELVDIDETVKAEPPELVDNLILENVTLLLEKEGAVEGEFNVIQPVGADWGYIEDREEEGGLKGFGHIEMGFEVFQNDEIIGTGKAVAGGFYDYEDDEKGDIVGMGNFTLIDLTVFVESAEG